MDFLNVLYKQYGIILEEEVIPVKGVDGIAVGMGGKPPLVVLKPDMGDHQKQFVMAHELGHVLLGHLDNRSGKFGDERVEREADVFACVLLAVGLAMQQRAPIAGEVLV